jgi:hypothetical protein
MTIEEFDEYIKKGGLMESPRGLADIRKSAKDGVEGYMCYPLIGYGDGFFLTVKEVKKML